MSRPLAGITILSYIIAAWALFYGLIDLFVGFKLADKNDGHGWLFIITGLLSTIFAIYLAFNPLEGSLAIVWVLGIYALVLGIVFAIQAFKTRPAKKAVKGKK